MDVDLLDEMNGWDLAKRIKEQAGGTKPLLIAVTGWGREEDCRYSAESGIAPDEAVDPEALEALLKKVQAAMP